MDPNAPHSQPPHPLALLRRVAAERRAAGLGRRLAAREPGPEAVVDLASNDYLGLSRDKRLADAAVTPARDWGTGPTRSRPVTRANRLPGPPAPNPAPLT